MIKSVSIPLRLLYLVATLTVGTMAFAVAPLPEVSATKPLGSTQSYTLKVTDAPSATNYAGAGTDGTIYVSVDQAYTFNIKATEDSNYDIAIREVDTSGNDSTGNVNGSQDGAGPDTTYIDVTRTFTAPGTYTIARAYYFYGSGFTHAAYLSGAVSPLMTTEPIRVTVVKVDMLRVPSYLFSKAEYWTPIKFKILPEECNISVDEIASVKVIFKYNNTPVEISGLKQHTEAVSGINTFECYIDPANYSAIDVGGNHFSTNASFTVEVELANAPALSVQSDEADPEGNVDKWFADKNVYARDIHDDNLPVTVSDPVAFVSVVSKKRYEVAALPEGWGTDIGSEFPGSGIRPELHFIQDHADLSAPTYWEEPNKPKWKLLSNPGVIWTPDWVTNNCFDNALMTSDSNWGSSLDGKPALSSDALLTDPRYPDSYDAGTYVAKNFGTRNGVYFFISYGGKEVPDVIPDDQKAMDLDKDTAITSLNWCKCVGAVSINITDPTAATTGTAGLIKNTLNLGLAILGCVPGVIGSALDVFGVADAIFGFKSPTESSPGDALTYAQVQAFKAYTSPVSDPNQWVAWISDVADMERISYINALSSGAQNEFDAKFQIGVDDPRKVGDMMSIFIECPRATG